jgi:DNA ligase-1
MWLAGTLAGKIAKYKHFEVGVKEAPRFPVFLGFRNPLDM